METDVARGGGESYMLCCWKKPFTPCLLWEEAGFLWEGTLSLQSVSEEVDFAESACVLNKNGWWQKIKHSEDTGLHFNIHIYSLAIKVQAFFIRCFFLFLVWSTRLKARTLLIFYDYTPDNTTATTKPPQAFSLISVLDLPTLPAPPSKSTHWDHKPWRIGIRKVRNSEKGKWSRHRHKEKHFLWRACRNLVPTLFIKVIHCSVAHLWQLHCSVNLESSDSAVLNKFSVIYHEVATQKGFVYLPSY